MTMPRAVAAALLLAVPSWGAPPRPLPVRPAAAARSRAGAPALAALSAARLPAPAAALGPALAAAPLRRAPAPRPAWESLARLRTDAGLAALRAGAPGRISDERARALSGRLLGLEEERGGEPGSVAAAFSRAAPLSRALAASSRPAGASPARPRAARRKAGLRARLHYASAMGRSFFWYMTTNVSVKWERQRREWLRARAEGPVAVSRQRAFFAAMRVTGMTGRFYPLGPAPMADGAMLAEMRRAFARYFDGPGIGAREREAFDRFLVRALSYNAEHRSHAYLNKTVRDALLAASLLRPDQVAERFDSLLLDDARARVEDYQASGEAARTLEAFRATVRELLAREDPGDPSRVVAAVLLGSFVTGSAGPRSDFDLELLTADGSSRRVPRFAGRLAEAWAGQETNPAVPHDRAGLNERAYLDLVYPSSYLVVALEASVEAQLSRAPGEPPAFSVRRDVTWLSRLGRALQAALVRSAILRSDLAAALSRGR